MEKVFSERLLELMVLNNLNILSLSKECNCPKSCISVWLKYNAYPSLKNIVKIADYFNCSLDYLLGLSDNYTISRCDGESSFIDRLDFLVKDTKISYYKLSKELGIDERNFTRWKKGIVPRTETLIEIAKYFCVSFDYLIGRSKNL